MPNEIIGRLFKFAGEKTGQGQNGPWINLTVVFETTTDRFPKKVALQFWGDRATEIKNFQPGDELRVSFDIESREYQDKWYTDARVWKVERIGATTAPGATYVNTQQAAPQQQAASGYSQPASAYSQPAAPAPSADSFNSTIAPADDDLPF